MVMKILEELLKKNIIKQEEYDVCLQELKNSEITEENLLIQKGIIKKEEILKIKSDILNVPIFKDVDILEIPETTLAIIPEESASYYKMVPLRLAQGVLEVGMLDPEDIKAKEVLSFLARQGKFDFKIYLIQESDLEDVFKRYENIQDVVGEALTELQGDAAEEGGDVDLFYDENKDASKLGDDAPIIKMVSAIFKHGVEARASDVHIEPTAAELRIRFRVDGILQTSLKLPKVTHSAIVARVKILSRLRIDETRIPQDGRFSAKIDKKEIDFRVSTFPTKLGEKVVIRILDPTEGLRTYKEIGLSENNLKILREQIRKPYGMILSTGPTGSGKTTTLYSILQELNQPGVNIVTLEDPIEYFVSGVNQSQIRAEIGYTFAKGLRSVVRQDPDIIMVGEIRDEESANLATHAALTGHILLSTIHTNNAIGVVSRLMDMKIRSFLIPSTLNIAVGQRLARKICPYCMEKVKPEPAVQKMMIDELSKLPNEVRKTLNIPEPMYIYRAKGCPKCNNKGEKGRIGIFEILKMTDELEKVIINDPTESALEQEVRRQGMINMRQDGIIKALEGKLSIEEVIRVTDSDSNI